MNLSDALGFFATVALGLAAVSGLLLALDRKDKAQFNSLYRARIAVLFQLTSVALILGILPMVMRAKGIEEGESLRISSIAMAVMIALSMLLTRRTYAVSRAEHAETITRLKQLVFYSPLAIQTVLAGVAGAGLWDAAVTGVYLSGLLVLLALAVYQLIRFLRFEKEAC
jgi:hypothetical protein